MDSRIPTLFGGIGRDGGRGSPRFEFGNPFCVVGVGLSGPGLDYIKRAARYFVTTQQFYVWRQR